LDLAGVRRNLEGDVELLALLGGKNLLPNVVD
jgi:hypothetical protein